MQKNILSISLSATLCAAGTLGADIIPLYNEHEYHTFLQENTHQPIVIQYAASWCHVCNNVSPLVNDIIQDPEFKDVIAFARIDVDTLPALCKAHNIQGIPTFSYMHRGRLIKQVTGVKNMDDFHHDFKHSLRSTFRLASNDNSSLTQMFRDFFKSSPTEQSDGDQKTEGPKSYFASFWATMQAWYHWGVEKVKALFSPSGGIKEL